MNYEQSEAILSHTAGKEISSENVATLVEVTEGWAAGLQLAGLTMSMRDNPDDFVADFSGSDRFISDYLSQQVLTGLSDERRTTLLRLSALDTMSSELVLDATGSDSAQQLFDELESSSLFFIALDDRRQWFRFHHLFADLLRYQLRAERPGDEEKISARAAQWHLDRNAVDEAVPYLIRARRWEAVLSVVLRRGAQVFERGEIATVVRWIENVPESVLARNIDAVLCHGILVGLLGQSALAENILMTVTNNPAATRGQMICAEAFLSSLVQSLPGMSRSFDSALRTIELIENNPGIDYPDLLHLTDARSLETIAVAAASRAQFFENNLDLAREWMQRTLATEGAVYSLWRINALGGLALIEAFSGNMEAAGDLARESLSTARDTGTLPHWGNADAFLALAVSAIENGTPAQASIPLYEARIRAGASGRTQQLWICHLVECLMMEATAGSQPAVSPEGPPPAIVADRLRALRIRLRRATGHPDMPNPGPLRSGTGVAELAELTANALSVGQAQLAADWLTQLDGAEFDSQPLRHVQRDLLHAWAGRNGKGIDQSVRDALSLAAEHGLIEVFVRAGPEVLALAAASSAVPEFRAAILDRARAAAVPLPGTELQIPLTKREVEVLSYLPSHYTNQELAEMCFVSVNTIKTHMVHIYQKLGAPNRSSAVTRARELGLL
jgi:LuxR family maltose regulon positive regulatory protein